MKKYLKITLLVVVAAIFHWDIHFPVPEIKA